MFNARAEMMGLGWTPGAGLLGYEPTPIVEELVENVIENQCGLLATLTWDNTARQQVPEQRRSNVIFQTFVRDLFEPSLLKEVGKRFQEGRAQGDNFVEKKQCMFQEEMVNSANAWMRE